MHIQVWFYRYLKWLLNLQGKDIKVSTSRILTRKMYEINNNLSQNQTRHLSKENMNDIGRYVHASLRNKINASQSNARIVLQKSMLNTYSDRMIYG